MTLPWKSSRAESGPESRGHRLRMPEGHRRQQDAPSLPKPDGFCRCLIPDALNCPSTASIPPEGRVRFGVLAAAVRDLQDNGSPLAPGSLNPSSAARFHTST
jgi:hypothetical protein